MQNTMVIEFEKNIWEKKEKKCILDGVKDFLDYKLKEPPRHQGKTNLQRCGGCLSVQYIPVNISIMSVAEKIEADDMKKKLRSNVILNKNRIIYSVIYLKHCM